MGYVVAANPLAQMLFSPLFGWWGNRLGTCRMPIILSLIIFIMANASYSILELIHWYPKYWMLMSRFFVGISSGKLNLLLFSFKLLSFFMIISQNQNIIGSIGMATAL